ncbi:stage III sporulation protein AA [Desulfotruncus alcoholivorax]|uniref:stage III sporulation protein AA n=1 Tax=Desulfotruncus alcoholivorax TaxID=265477 RepID=UPI001EE5078A|nr:stage III sporulation protein AA [Desulfotruncus alcoholivorax]
MTGLTAAKTAIPAEGAWQQIVSFLSPGLKEIISAVPQRYLSELEEIRLRRDRPLMLGVGSADFFVRRDGSVNHIPAGAFVIEASDLEKVIHNISGYSIYALEEELRNGYLTLPGGHRVGLTGKAVLDNGRVKTIKHISGLNIRVCREVKGIAGGVLNKLIDHKTGSVYHTVIFSPPRCGKTTLLRDLVRQISDGVPGFNFPGRTVGVVDERSEIAGCHRGVPQMDVGVRTDVLDGCPKAQGMMILLRSMSPDVIVTDEIGKMEDIKALEEVFNAGVRVIVTIHGSSLRELAARPALKYLLQLNIIERFVQLGRSRGVGTVEKIYTGSDLLQLGVKQ